MSEEGVRAQWAEDRIRTAAENKRLREEWARYHETKRLAEMAWAGMQANSEFVDTTQEQIALAAWSEAEAMYAESERRRPQE